MPEPGRNARLVYTPRSSRPAEGQAQAMSAHRDYPKLLTADVQAAIRDREMAQAVELYRPLARAIAREADVLALWAELMDELAHGGYAWAEWAEHWPGGEASLDRPVYFLVLGIKALQEEAFDLAGYYLVRAHEAELESPVPLAYIGIMHESQGCPSEAVAYYQRCLDLDPDLFSILNASGNLYHELGFYELAIEMYSRATPLLHEAGNQAILLGNLGNSQRALGLIDDAIATYTEAIALDPSQPNNPLFLAETLLEARRPGQVTSCLVDVVQSPFFDEWPAEARRSCYGLLARAHFQAEDYPAAALFWWLRMGGRLDEEDQEGVSSLLKALFAWAITKPDPTSDHVLAKLDRHLGYLDAALLHAKRAVKLAPDRSEHFLELGATLLLHGKRPVALEALEEAATLAPEKAEIHAARALALWEDQPDAAEGALYEAIRLEPSQALHRCDLAWLRLARGQVGLARTAFEEALLLWDRAPILYGSHGPAAQRGCYSDIVDPYLAENANSAEAATRLLTAANYLILSGRREPARKALHRLLSEQPDNIDALRNYAWLLGRQGWSTESLSIWRRVLAADPTDRISRFFALRLRAAEGEAGKAEAIEALERGLGEAADDHLARLLLAKLVEPSAEALAHYETLSRRLPEMYSPWYWLGQCHFHRREIDAAQTPLERAVALNPSFAPAQQLLAQVYGQLGDQARQHQHLGFSYLLTAKYHLAREHFEEALALDESMAEAQEGITRVERRLLMLEQPTPADVVRLVAPRYRIR